MRKLSILLVALLLCVAVAACQNWNTPGGNTPTETPTTTAPTETPSTAVPTDDPLNNELQGSSINNQLISLVGQPLSYFTEEFGLQLEGLEMFYEGPPVGEYTVGETTYVFNNYLGYDELTEETPCTAIHTKYTELLPGIERGALTEEILIELFGPHIEEYDNQKMYQYDGVNMLFKISVDGNYDDVVRISKMLSWE